jgi:hypothetical protein
VSEVRLKKPECPCGIARVDCTYHKPDPETDLEHYYATISRIQAEARDGKTEYVWYQLKANTGSADIKAFEDFMGQVEKCCQEAYADMLQIEESSSD